MKLLGEFQNLLLAGVELGLKSVSLPLKLYPIPLQVFKRGGHVRMQDSVGNISFHNGLYDHRENGGLRHYKTLRTSSYPFEVRIKRDEILMPQCLDIYLVQHPTGSDKPLAMTLIVVLVVKYQTLNEHLMWAIALGLTKLS